MKAVGAGDRSGQSVDLTRRQHEVATVTRELLGCPETGVKVGEWLSHTVTRVHLENTSVIVKRLKPTAAWMNDLVATRWLPAVGLGRLAVKPLASKVDASGACAWLVYEDLGDSTLATHPEQAEVAVKAIAQFHTRLAGHYLLAECRSVGRSRGGDFHASSFKDAITALLALRPETHERALLRQWLIERLAAPAGVVDTPETLLHGDLWTKNILPGPRLIDWDKAGVVADLRPGDASFEVPYRATGPTARLLSRRHLGARLGAASEGRAQPYLRSLAASPARPRRRLDHPRPARGRPCRLALVGARPAAQVA